MLQSPLPTLYDPHHLIPQEHPLQPTPLPDIQRNPRPLSHMEIGRPSLRTLETVPQVHLWVWEQDGFGEG